MRQNERRERILYGEFVCPKKVTSQTVRLPREPLTLVNPGRKRRVENDRMFQRWRRRDAIGERVHHVERRTQSPEAKNEEEEPPGVKNEPPAETFPRGVRPGGVLQRHRKVDAAPRRNGG